MRNRVFVVGVVAALAACDASFNRDLLVEAGAHAGGGHTINGRVEVGARAEVGGALRTVNGTVAVAGDARTGDLATVNGAIVIGPRAQVGELASVNGSIEVGSGSRVGGSVGTVNGGLRAAGGTIVEGEVSTVNGGIDLRGTTVRGSVTNHAGDLRLLDGTLVEGDVLLEAPDHPLGRVDTVVVGVGAQVRGALRVARPIKLFVHPSARLARVEGAQPIPLEGTDVQPDR
jgi:hypothetical protein